MRKMILAVLAMVIATPLIHTGSANAQNYPWCAQGGESTNCGFVSYEQCMAASRWCDRNPMYQPPAGEPRSRRSSSRRRG
jgi:Protein of unknown function (DUF3551)